MSLMTIWIIVEQPEWHFIPGKAHDSFPHGSATILWLPSSGWQQRSRLYPFPESRLNTWLLCIRSSWYPPVKSESVEKGRQPLHDQQDGHSEHRKEAKHRDQKRHPDSGGDPQTQTHHHAPQHLRQLWKPGSRKINNGTDNQTNNRTKKKCMTALFLGVYTHEREPSWGPRDAGTTLCWKCNPGRTRWCGWPGTAARRQSQTAKCMWHYRLRVSEILKEAIEDLKLYCASF